MPLFEVSRLQSKAVKQVVEPRGIEPLTSTMPL